MRRARGARHTAMADECCGVAQAGSAVCDLPAPAPLRPLAAPANCPQCGASGKPVGGQTVKSVLSASLRALQPAAYYFCRTRDCAVVYFSQSGQMFTTGQVREQAYQKDPEAANILVFYCFDYRAAALRAAPAAARNRIVAEINAGLQAGQCACDLRNPQGTCCLGNVLAMVRRSPAPGARPGQLAT